MTNNNSKSTCLLCKSKYTGNGMIKHLKTCLPRHLDKDRVRNFRYGVFQSFYHILVRAYHLPQYWLHLTVDKNAALEDLDRFLRDIWLECCGHLSVFFYQDNEIEMMQKLGNILRPGMELHYQYDFGSTTELRVIVVAEYRGSMDNHKPIQILARNEAPEIPCQECGKFPAAYVCTACNGGWGSGWLCKGCAEEHECGDEILLPVVNSPRTGVCSYEG